MDILTLQVYEASSKKALEWFLQQLKDEGSFDFSKNLQDWFHLPYLLHIYGLNEQVSRLFHYIAQSVLPQEPSDLSLSPELLSWLAVAAQKAGLFDLSYKFFANIRNYYCAEQGGFSDSIVKDDTVLDLDLISTIYGGWSCLYFGDLNKATRAGNSIARILSLQTNLDAVFYLKLDLDGHLITTFDTSHAKQHAIFLNHIDQLHYLIGFAIGFLGKLYQACQDVNHLRTAQTLQEWYKTAAFPTEGEIIWGSAVLAKTTQEQRYLKQSQEYANEIVQLQQLNGLWTKLEKKELLSSARHAIFLKESIPELSSL